MPVLARLRALHVPWDLQTWTTPPQASALRAMLAISHLRPRPRVLRVPRATTTMTVKRTPHATATHRNARPARIPLPAPPAAQPANLAKQTWTVTQVPSVTTVQSVDTQPNQPSAAMSVQPARLTWTVMQRHRVRSVQRDSTAAVTRPSRAPTALQVSTPRHQAMQHASVRVSSRAQPGKASAKARPALTTPRAQRVTLGSFRLPTTSSLVLLRVSSRAQPGKASAKARPALTTPRAQRVTLGSFRLPTTSSLVLLRVSSRAQPGKATAKVAPVLMTP